MTCVLMGKSILLIDTTLYMYVPINFWYGLHRRSPYATEQHYRIFCRWRKYTD